MTGNKVGIPLGRILHSQIILKTPGNISFPINTVENNLKNNIYYYQPAEKVLGHFQ